MDKTILCYGDSNTHGFNPLTGQRYPKSIRWPGKLQQILGADYQIIEEGCNGRTTIFDDPEEGWKNGLDYLRPCLSSHKPIHLVILMLGSNDLKQTFHASAEQIAAGIGTLVEVIQDFTVQKQGFLPDIILVSPPEIGPRIGDSPFRCSFAEDAVLVSKALSACYQKIAAQKNCIFFDAAQYVQPSEADSLHLLPEAHAVLAKELARLTLHTLERSIL